MARRTQRMLYSLVRRHFGHVPGCLHEDPPHVGVGVLEPDRLVDDVPPTDPEVAEVQMLRFPDQIGGHPVVEHPPDPLQWVLGMGGKGGEHDIAALLQLIDEGYFEPVASSAPRQTGVYVGTVHPVSYTHLTLPTTPYV